MWKLATTKFKGSKFGACAEHVMGGHLVCPSSVGCDAHS